MAWTSPCFRSADQRVRSSLSGNYLLGVGRLGWMKGFDLLIDAFSGENTV